MSIMDLQPSPYLMRTFFYEPKKDHCFTQLFVRMETAVINTRKQIHDVVLRVVRGAEHDQRKITIIKDFIWKRFSSLVRCTLFLPRFKRVGFHTTVLLYLERVNLLLLSFN